MTINLRKEFRELIDKHGHWLVIRQAIPGRKCACINPLTEDANVDCGRCLGSGYAYVDRFIRGRKSRPVRLNQVSGSSKRTAIMEMTGLDNTFYVQHTVKPTSLDYVLEIALDPLDQTPERPYRVLSVHKITDAREQRDANGRIEYYALSTVVQAWPEFNINA